MKSLLQFMTAGLFALSMLATAHAGGLTTNPLIKRFYGQGSLCDCTCNGTVWQCAPTGCAGLEGQACSLDSRPFSKKPQLTKSIDIKPVILPGDNFKKRKGFKK